jgi:thiol:disulfide interchange protein DsbC
MKKTSITLAIMLGSTVLLSSCFLSKNKQAASAKNIPFEQQKHAAQPQAQIVGDEDKQRIIQRLSANFVLSEFKAQDIKVSKTPIVGIFEVLVKGEVIYTTIDGNYVFIGNLLDVRNKVSLTQKSIEIASVVDWKKLPFKDAFVWEKGKVDNKRQIAVFSDPNCQYCKKFEQELLKIDNIRVYNFLIPILSEDSVQKAQQIWCQKDDKSRHESFEQWMTKGTAPVATLDVNKNCNSPHKQNMELAQKLGISGTPTIILSDGSRISGFVDADELSARLAKL